MPSKGLVKLGLLDGDSHSSGIVVANDLKRHYPRERAAWARRKDLWANDPYLLQLSHIRLASTVVYLAKRHRLTGELLPHLFTLANLSRHTLR